MNNDEMKRVWLVVGQQTGNIIPCADRQTALKVSSNMAMRYNEETKVIEKEVASMHDKWLPLSEIPRGAMNRYFKFGDVVFPLNLDYINYESRINLGDKTYCKYSGNSAFPTINELVRTKEIDEYSYAQEYSVNVEDRYVDKFTEKLVNKIVKKFQKHGFNVTKQAIMHNYEAYMVGMKSGYLDKENGYHLFTPCSLNPLSFRACQVDKHFEDWQITYCC